jgi:hypothetical protein
MDHWYVLPFVADIVIATALAIAIAFGFRNGIGHLLGQASLLLRKAQSWPN